MAEPDYDDGARVCMRRHAFAEFERRHGYLSEETRIDLRVAFRDLRALILFIYEEPAHA